MPCNPIKLYHALMMSVDDGRSAILGDIDETPDMDKNASYQSEKMLIVSRSRSCLSFYFLIISIVPFLESLMMLEGFALV